MGKKRTYDFQADIFNIRRDMLLKLFQDKQYKPMRFKELAGVLGVPKDERDELKLILDSLISKKLIAVNLRGQYELAQPELLEGKFTAHPKGFGFVSVEGVDNDFYISKENTLDAMSGDRVKIRKVMDAARGRKSEGAIVAVIERANDTVVGIYHKNKNFGFVVPDNPKLTTDIHVESGRDGGAMNGHKVVVKLLDYGKPGRNPEGEIVEILGHIGDPGVDILSIVRAYGIPEEFPPEVMKEAAAVPDQVTVNDMKNRIDLRHLQTVTIDGEDAKDLDDAVTISRDKDGGYRLGVHIADVSHYVREGSALDKEALRRGTSVYLTDRVIPMLPRRLSNGICSLNQGEDRLALSCMMEIDKKGNIVGHEIAQTVINVDRRMTYTAVKAIIEDHDPKTCETYKDFTEMFELMAECAAILREKRRQRGGIDFDLPESKIYLDEDGKAVDVRPYDRNSATKIIEDFMLAANETVAEDYYWQEIPFLFRTHEEPDRDRILKLTQFLKGFGYYLKSSAGELHPKEFQKLLGKIEGTPEADMISRLVLRSMSRARYTTVCNGHFGLAVQFYTHFTSPIRRYPDLQIHRIISEIAEGRYSEEREGHYRKILDDIATQTSTTERRADEAERETDKLKKAEFMKGHIGEFWHGVISGITAFGIFVELPNTCEGMISLQNMDDYYILDEKNNKLVGEMSGQTYSLGDKIDIYVDHVDLAQRTVDFLPAEMMEYIPKRKRKWGSL